MADYAKSPVFSSPAYWIALTAGVVGIGAAAMQERRKGSAARATPFSAKSHEELGREMAQRVSRYAGKVRAALPPNHHILEINDDDDFLASLAIAVEMSGKKITPGLLSRLMVSIDAYVNTEEEQEGDVENADPLVIAFLTVERMLRQLKLTGKGGADYRQIGRRLAAKVKIESDKVRRVLPPDSPILDHGDDAYLAALAMTLGMTGKKLTPLLLSRLDAVYEHWMDDAESDAAIEDQDPLVIPLEVIHSLL